jgi:hypothetical protein
VAEQLRARLGRSVAVTAWNLWTRWAVFRRHVHIRMASEAELAEVHLATERQEADRHDRLHHKLVAKLGMMSSRGVFGQWKRMVAEWRCTTDRTRALSLILLLWRAVTITVRQSERNCPVRYRRQADHNLSAARGTIESLVAQQLHPTSSQQLQPTSSQYLQTASGQYVQPASSHLLRNASQPAATSPQPWHPPPPPLPPPPPPPQAWHEPSAPPQPWGLTVSAGAASAYEASHADLLFENEVSS